MIPRLYVKGSAGKMPVEDMRALFEKLVEQTPQLKQGCNLATWSVNDQFLYYRDDETEALWLGFALGIRQMERAVSYPLTVS